MLWVLVFAVIAVAGLAMVVGYGVWLAHKAADVMSEVAVLGEQGGQLAELLSQISPGQDPGGPDSLRDLTLNQDGRYPPGAQDSRYRPRST